MLTPKQERQLKYLRQKQRPGFLYDLDCKACNEQASFTDTERAEVVRFMNDHAGHDVSMTAVPASKAEKLKSDPDPIPDDLPEWTTDDALRKILDVGKELAVLARADKSYEPLLAQARHAWQCAKVHQVPLSPDGLAGIMYNLDRVMRTKGMSLYVE